MRGGVQAIGNGDRGGNEGANPETGPNPTFGRWAAEQFPEQLYAHIMANDVLLAPYLNEHLARAP